MTQIGFVICEIAFLLASIIFVREKKRRNPFKIRFFISSLLMFALMIITSSSVKMDFYVADMFFQVLIAVCMVIYLKLNWDISFSIAIYDTIWARVFWWILIEVQKILLAIWAYVNGDPKPIWYLSALVCFLALSLFILAKTVARWIPENRSKIGPRQLLSAVLIATIFENLAFLPELRTLSTGIDKWMIFFLLQLICIFILYLQNELFRKSAMI